MRHVIWRISETTKVYNLINKFYHLEAKILINLRKKRFFFFDFDTIQDIYHGFFKEIPMDFDLGVELQQDTLITSKTDLKSRITYCNKDFYEYSKFSENEVLGKPHNIVRHKDMPRAVFKLLWDYIKQGKEVFALVKNRTKDNQHYWVFANITPSIDINNNVIGYYSVRRKPNPKAVEKIIPVYHKMLEAERTSSLDSSISILNQTCHQAGMEYNEFVFELQRNA